MENLRNYIIGGSRVWMSTAAHSTTSTCILLFLLLTNPSLRWTCHTLSTVWHILNLSPPT